MSEDVSAQKEERGGKFSSPKKINDLYYRMHWMFNRKEHLIASWC